MKKLLILSVISTSLLLTGCAGMVDYAATALAEMKDTDRYENIRESVNMLCEAKNYDMFVDRYGKGVVDKFMVDACSPVTRKTDPRL